MLCFLCVDFARDLRKNFELDFSFVVLFIANRAV